MSKLIQPSEMDNLIFRTSIVQSLLDQVKGEAEDYDINIGVPIAKSFEDNGKLIIAGYSSVEVIDSQDEFIPLETLKEAWDKFSSNPDFMIGTLMHSNIPVIHILKEYKDSKGEMWKSGVDDTGLFIVAEVNDSIEKGKQTKELIQQGKLTGFSIGGEALASTVVNEGKSYTRIDKMELHEIAVVDRPANKPSVFTIVKRLKQEPKGDKERFINHFQITEGEFDNLYNILGEEIFSLLPERGQKTKKIIKLEVDYGKLDKALEKLSKRVEHRGNQWCVVHCTGPDAGKAIKCFPTKEQANAMHRAIQVNKQDDRPPKAGWDSCMSRASGLEGINDPEAFCGNLWYNDRSKWNSFVKGENKKKRVTKIINKKTLSKLDKGTSSLLRKLKSINLKKR